MMRLPLNLYGVGGWGWGDISTVVARERGLAARRGHSRTTNGSKVQTAGRGWRAVRAQLQQEHQRPTWSRRWTPCPPPPRAGCCACRPWWQPTCAASNSSSANTSCMLVMVVARKVAVRNGGQDRPPRFEILLLGRVGGDVQHALPETLCKRTTVALSCSTGVPLAPAHSPLNDLLVLAVVCGTSSSRVQDEGPLWVCVSCLDTKRKSCLQGLPGSLLPNPAQLNNSWTTVDNSGQQWTATACCQSTARDQCMRLRWCSTALTGGVRGAGRQVGGHVRPVGPVGGPVWKHGHGHGHMQGTQVMTRVRQSAPPVLYLWHTASRAVSATQFMRVTSVRVRHAPCQQG